MPKYFYNEYTIADAATPLELNPVILIDADLMVLTNSVDLGNMENQKFVLAADKILSYRNAEGIDLSQLWFKNTVGASVGVVIVSGWLA